MSDTLPAHSPVGASTAKRLLACALSVGPGVPGVEDDESDYSASGTAVHSLLERSFTERKDAWQFIGQPFNNMIATKAMANGAQVMLDAVRRAHPYRDQSNFFVEKKFHCPTIHPMFFGTCDALYLHEGASREEAEKWIAFGASQGAMLALAEAKAAERFVIVHIWDYKNGVGVIIEVQENEQTQYYACGALETFIWWEKADLVVLHICQPNGFHPDGRVRHWTTTPEELAEWLEDTLVPGIDHALTSNEAVSGPHCQFCPKRFGACPALLADMEELETMMQQVEKVGVDALTNEQIGHLLTLCERASIVKKATLQTGYFRLNAGGAIPGWKLVKGRKNRDWKDGAEDKATALFGEQAYTKPELKSPAQIEELPLGTTFTAEWAQKPDAGLTMAPASDKRAEVSRDTKSLFTPVVVAPAEPVVAPVLAPAKRRGTLAA